MFATPPVVPTTVFAKIPPEFHRSGPNQWAESQGGDPAPTFLEGPSFDRKGNLWCVDIPFGRIFRIDPKGEWDLAAQYDGWPNGLKIHKDGSIFPDFASSTINPRL